MDWKSLLPSIVGGLIVAVGWIVSHYFNKSRDIAAEKRKLRISYLLEAYRKLEVASNSDNPHQTEAAMESAIADIQLLGTPAQVELVQKLARQFADEGVVSFDQLLQNLRQELRRELELEAVDGKLVFFRISRSHRGSRKIPSNPVT